jgi:hypothetical protein
MTIALFGNILEIYCKVMYKVSCVTVSTCKIFLTTESSDEDIAVDNLMPDRSDTEVSKKGVNTMLHQGFLLSLLIFSYP